MTDLSGKSAIVTGASRGIGAATAQALARSGARVMLAARDLDACQAIAAGIEAAGGRAAALRCDVSDYDEVAALVDGTRDRFGRLDILINNAGVIAPIDHLAAADPHDWARCIAIDLVGAYNAIRTAAGPLRQAGGGVIVNVSSGAAHRPLEGWSAYCAAKAGLAMLTRSVALELGADGIRIYGFAPGTVDTDMQGAIRASGLNPISRMAREEHAQPEVPAQAIAWLCSDAAADLAGQELSIRDEPLRRRIGLPPL